MKQYPNRLRTLFRARSAVPAVPAVPAVAVLPVLLVALSGAGAHAQGRLVSEDRGPWTGTPGVTESVATIMARGIRPGSAPVGEQRVRVPLLRSDRELMRDNPDSPRVSRWGIQGEKAEAAVGASAQAAVAPRITSTPNLSFTGGTVSETPGWVPPDAMGAAGPTQFLVCVNGLIRTFDKTTGLADGALNADTDVFFQSVRGTTGTSDPRVRFDRLTNRWFVVMINTASVNNRVLIAVSSGPVITSASSFTFYYFVQDAVAPTGNINQFADYPTLGLDANALYIGCNMFNSTGSYTGTSGWVVRKASLLGTGPIVATAFRNLSLATGPGLYTPQGVDNDDPNATEGYFIGVDNQDYGLLQIRRITDPGGTPSLGGGYTVTVPVTSDPAEVNPLGSACPLDGLDSRLTMAQIHRDATGARTLWAVHAIHVDASGVANGAADRDAARWYEIANLTTTPTLRQSGTLFDPAAGNPRQYFNPSVAMSGQGNVLLSCNIASATDMPGIALAGRSASDPLGTMQAPVIALPGAFTYNAQKCTTQDPAQRWGDYSFTSVDPNDDMTLWTAQEFVSATNKWGLKVMRVQAPPPAVPAACSPSSLAAGTANVTLSLTGLPANGAGFYDPGAGFPNHVTASLGAGISVNSVSYVDPTHLTLNVTVAPDAPAGPRLLTVTNPDGQTATSATPLVNIAGPYALGDVTTALRAAAGIIPLDPLAKARLDLSASGSVDVADAIRIARKVAGLDVNP